MESTIEEKAPFNMAIATLMRLNDLLRDITKVEQNLFMDQATKQENKVKLVKDLFMQAVPLLDEKYVKELREEIIKLKPHQVTVLNQQGSSTKEGGKRVIFDEKLEHTINNYIIDIQLYLQKGNYFMPPRRDLGRAIGEF